MTFRSPTKDVGVQAVVEVARSAGLRFARSRVLRDRSNLLVHLSPAPVVARVATATAVMRPGEAWLAREVAVAGYLARAGAPVVGPSTEIDPGPHHRAGLVMTFWEYVEAVGAPVDAAGAGRRLRERIEGLGLPDQAVHGDVHLGNVLMSARGPLWNDWEDTFAGPPAWDLGCLHASGPPFGSRDPDLIAAAQAAYGSPPEPEVLEAFIDARHLQVCVWRLVLGRLRGDQEQVEKGLVWLRARAGD